MTRQEFQAWCKDFCATFPDFGDWFAAREQQTRDIWFEKSFAALEVSDAKAATLKMLHSTTLSKFENQRVPAIITELCGGIRHDRTKRQERAKRLKENQRAGTMQHSSDLAPPVIFGVLNRYLGKIDDWRAETGNMETRIPDIPKDVKSRIIDDLIK